MRLPAPLLLLFTFGLAAAPSVACSDAPGAGNAPSDATGGDAGVDAAPAASNDGGAGDAASDAAPGVIGVRVGPEIASPITTALGAFDDSALLRCPAGSLVVGLDVALPPATSGTAPYTARKHRLRCAPVDTQGALGPPVTVDPPSGALPWPYETDPFAGWVWTPLTCPSGQVATRLVGAFDHEATSSLDLVTLGLRCQPLDAVVDGGAVSAGAPSAPATLGAASGAKALDIACAGGSAVAGIVYGSFASEPTDLVLRSLCRDVLRTKLPGGASWDPTLPVRLGPPTTLPPLTTNGELPSNPDTIKVVRDCPAGQVVTAVDGGRSNSLAGAPLLDVQITCRALGPDGSASGQTTNVGTTTATLQSACLLGQAVTGVTFAGGEITVLGKKYFNAEDLRTACRVPVPGDARTSAPIPGWVPGRPSETALERSTTCPSGSVATGLDVFAPVADGERILTGIALRCRPLER